MLDVVVLGWSSGGDVVVFGYSSDGRCGGSRMK